MSLAARVLCLSLFLMSCSTKPTATCAESCPGCCDGSGTCQAGTDNAVCGTSGFACSSCVGGSNCTFGTCVVAQAGGGNGSGGGGTGGGSTGGGSAGGGGTGGGNTGGGSGGGGTGGGGTGGGSTGGGSGSCAGTLASCGTQCIDTLAAVDNCGRCGNVCGSGQVCINGNCALLPTDCTVSECGAGYFCDPVTRRCATGCRLPTDCPSGGSCAAGVCACPPAQHACGQRCVTNNAITSCGLTCTSCGAPSNGSPSCDGTSCGFTCNSGFTTQGAACIDIDECVSGNGGCSANAACTNTPGSRTCACAAGYAGDGLTCTDLNECATGNGGCHAEAMCTNTPGSRTCACNPGYSGDGLTCGDVNECNTGNGGCSANAACTNTPGSRSCACNTGFTGNGLTCTDVNECATGNGGCHADATCTNNMGGRTCSCNTGFSGNGLSCTDINECATANGGCSINAACTNTSGSRTCVCNSGYFGNGITCSMTPPTQRFAVVRVGSGAAALSNASTEVHIQVRDLATGALITDIPLPTAVSGANSPLTLSGTATSEGNLTLTADNAFMVMAGYAAAPGTVGIAAAIGIPRVVGVVAVPSNAVSTDTLITDGYPQSSPRGAAGLNGNAFWVGGASSASLDAGIRYVVRGSTGSSTDVFATRQNIRATALINGQLYASSGTPTPNPDGGMELSRVFGIGTGAPTMSTTSIINFPGVTIANPTNFALLDRSTLINGPDTLYVADSSGNIAARKFEFNGASWVETATFPMASGSGFFLATTSDAASVTLLVSGLQGVFRWDDTGITGLAPPGTVVVGQTANTALRGLVVLP